MVIFGGIKFRVKMTVISKDVSNVDFWFNFPDALVVDTSRLVGSH